MVQVTTIQTYRNRMEEALGSEFVNGRLRITFDISSVAEANLQKKKFIQQQKQLRQIKRDVNEDMKNIRAAYKEASANVQPSASSAIFGGLFGKKSMPKTDVAQKRRELNQRRDNELKPYNDAKLTIDALILQLDDAKLKLTEYIDENK